MSMGFKHRRPAAAYAVVAAASAVVGLVSVTATQGATTPNFTVGIGIVETNNPSGTPLGSSNTASTTGAGIEQINAAGTNVAADGLFHTVTVDFSSALVTNPGLSGGNGVINASAAGLAIFDHLRLNNINGVTKPISVYVDDLTTDSTVITDFTTYDPRTGAAVNTIPVNSSNIGFANGNLSSSTSILARNISATSTDVVFDPGATTPANQAERLNLRFGTPETINQPGVAGDTTGWVRLVTSGTTALGPSRPIIDVSSTATFSFRIAIVVNDPLYGYREGTSNLWSDNGNWGHDAGASTNAPDSITATALFDEPLPTDGSPVTPRTVNLDGSRKLQVLEFATQVPYTIADTNNVGSRLAINRADSAALATISVEAGDHTVSVPVDFSDTAGVPNVWVSPSSSLTLNQSPTFSMAAANSTTAIAILQKRGAGKLTAPDLAFNGVGIPTVSVLGGTLSLTAAQTGTFATVTLGSATLSNGTGSGGTLSIKPAAGQTKTITTLSVPFASTLQFDRSAGGDAVIGTANVGLNSTLKLDAAGITPVKINALGLNVTGTTVTAKLDLTNDGVLTDYTNTAVPDAIRNNIILGYNGGDWQGKGITSSLLTTGSPYAIGYRLLTSGQTFMGLTAPDDTTFAYRYTRAGDGDLSGTVDFGDLLALAKNYNGSYDPIANGPKIWENGDFNYNGIVDFADLLLLAKNYNATVSSADLAASTNGAFAADFALAQSLVPEPTTFGLLAGGLTLLALRRDRRVAR